MSHDRHHTPEFQKTFTASIQSTLRQGLAFHQQGRFAEAEHFYNEALLHTPTHFDAMHLLGVLALQTNRIRSGVELIAKALQLVQSKR